MFGPTGGSLEHASKTADDAKSVSLVSKVDIRSPYEVDYAPVWCVIRLSHENRVVLRKVTFKVAVSIGHRKYSRISQPGSTTE